MINKLSAATDRPRLTFSPGLQDYDVGFNSGGNPVQIANDGSVQTLRVTTDNGNYNANFYALIPVYTPPSSMTLEVSRSSGNLSISFPTQPGYGYQAECKTNLTDAVWLPLGNAVPGDGTVQSVNDTTGESGRFYRVQIQ